MKGLCSTTYFSQYAKYHANNRVFHLGLNLRKKAKTLLFKFVKDDAQSTYKGRKKIGLGEAFVLLNIG